MCDTFGCGGVGLVPLGTQHSLADESATRERTGQAKRDSVPNPAGHIGRQRAVLRILSRGLLLLARRAAEGRADLRSGIAQHLARERLGAISVQV